MVALLVILTAANGWGQEEDSDASFAILVNPLGFAQFGPTLGTQVFVTEDVAIEAHVRFWTLGALSYVANWDDDTSLDSLSGIAFGLGGLYFLGDTEDQWYLGAFLDYQISEATYDQGGKYEWTSEDISYVFITNVGYRFRFQDGFFLNLGGFFGAAYTQTDWEYKDYEESDGTTGGSSTSTTPFGMLELSLGFEI
jgi:hypothetical protein